MTIAYREQGLVFRCGDNRLVGIAAISERATELGVLFLVGGPQYRVGSHRQFTLLARNLAEAGIPSLRFDYSGMGDSEGQRREFDKNEEDVAAAIDALIASIPGISRVILWGLCDAASTAMMFAHRHPQVSGMILLNPWVHDGEYSPEVKLAHYYHPLPSKRDRWRRLFRGEIRLFSSLKEMVVASVMLIAKRFLPRPGELPVRSFVQEMLHGLQQFRHGILIVLSEEDLTAREFSSLITHDRDWKKAMTKPDITIRTVLSADHTFSQSPWKENVSQMTVEWVKRQ